ncbi:MAG TPA: SDR family oxidoreductase, partial [Vicinamibacterales bacterium]|nr:SDR family oxidoreductase [Vicinamibacterales bacterium]
VLTYKWGTADEDAVREQFVQRGAREPDIVRADVGNGEDTAALMDYLRSTGDGVGVFVSNVSAALVTEKLEDYSPKALFRSIEYSAWPLYDYTVRLRDAFGAYPRYVIGLSSTGVDSYSRGYDFMAASKAVMETLCRYLSYRLEADGVRVNVVRTCNVRTLALEDTFGRDFAAFAGRFTRPEHAITPAEVGEAILALASGLLDGVSGQVITVDRGITFFDNIMHLYQERGRLQLA